MPGSSLHRGSLCWGLRCIGVRYAGGSLHRGSLCWGCNAAHIHL